MGRFRNIVLLFSLLSAAATVHASLIVDCSFDPYVEIPSILSNVGLHNVEAVIVPHPFWRFEGRTDRSFLVYHWDIDTPRRGQSFPAAGSREDLAVLSQMLRRHKIKLYSRIDIFNQKQDYNLSWFSLEDFSLDSRLYSDHLTLDPSRGIAALSPLFREMSSLPIDKWVIETDDLPSVQWKEYVAAAKKGLGSRALFYSSLTNRIPGAPLIHAYDFWSLREGPFLTPLPDLSGITNLSFSRGVHVIASDKLTINNIATVFFMLSRGLKISVPASFVRHPGLSRMLQIVESEKEFSIQLINKETMLLYSDAQVLSFHLRDTLAMYKIPAIIKQPGSLFSVVGSSILFTKDAYSYFLLYPGSVYLWEIK